MARRSDHTREQLKAMAIEAAVDIVQAEGAPGLSTRKVAKRIGYTVGTLYQVFENLDELILHVNARTLDELHGRMHEALGRCRDAHACLLSLGQTYWHFAHEQTSRWSLLFTHQLPAGQSAPPWFSQRVEAIHHLVEQSLHELVPQIPQAQINEAAQALWGGVHGICVLSLSDKFSLRQGVRPEALIENLFDNYLQGWRGSDVATAMGGGP